MRMTLSQQDLRSSDKRFEAKENSQEIEECTTEQEMTPPRDWKRIYVIMALVYAQFWLAATYSIQAPFFPFEAESKGATSTEYGFIFSIYQLAIIVSTPIYAKLISRITPRFFVTFGSLVSGLACCIFGILDYFPSGTPYIASAFIIRLIEGCGVASVMTAAFAIGAATFPENVGMAFSLMETAYGVGLIVGPTIGGALYEVGGFITPFVVNGGFLLLGCIILSFLLPRTDAVIPTGSQNFFRFMFDVEIVFYSLSFNTCLVVMEFNAATLEPHLREFDLTPVVLGLIFVVTGGIYALTTPIWGKLCDMGVSPLFINVAGSIMICAAFLLIGPVPFLPIITTLWTVIASLAVIGFGLSAKLVASFAGALQRSILRGFPDDLTTYSKVSALFTFSCSVGAFIGPSLGGILLDTTGYRSGTIVIFAIEAAFLGSLLLYIFIGTKKKKNEHEDFERRALLQSSVARRSLYSLSL